MEGSVSLWLSAWALLAKNKKERSSAHSNAHERAGRFTGGTHRAGIGRRDSAVPVRRRAAFRQSQNSSDRTRRRPLVPDFSEQGANKRKIVADRGPALAGGANPPTSQGIRRGLESNLKLRTLRQRSRGGACRTAPAVTYCEGPLLRCSWTIFHEPSTQRRAVVPRPRPEARSPATSPSQEKL